MQIYESNCRWVPGKGCVLLLSLHRVVLKLVRGLLLELCQVLTKLFCVQVVGKGTASFGKRHNKSHTLCRRCGKRSYHLQKATCGACGYPSAHMRRCKSPKIQRTQFLHTCWCCTATAACVSGISCSYSLQYDPRMAASIQLCVELIVTSGGAWIEGGCFK